MKDPLPAPFTFIDLHRHRLLNEDHTFDQSGLNPLHLVNSQTQDGLTRESY